jgi:hypothetical protein
LPKPNVGVFQVESRPNGHFASDETERILRSGDRSRHHSTRADSRSSHASLSGSARGSKITYLDSRLIPVLGALGVPLFQEQMLKIAIVMADFSGDEAEELQRALSYHRSQERCSVSSKSCNALQAMT